MKIDFSKVEQNATRIPDPDVKEYVDKILSIFNTMDNLGPEAEFQICEQISKHCKDRMSRAIDECSQACEDSLKDII